MISPGRLRPWITFSIFAFGLTATRVALPDEPADSEAKIRPFRIEVADSVLRDLKDRLAHTRFPDQIPGSDWGHGPDVAYVKELVAYWRDKYDWRAHEKQLNSLPQFITAIDGIDIHFIHVRSRHENATPLLLVHGWPGSFVEFQKIIGPLTDPEAHGGRAEDAFHVVVPSLPGFGFSGKPREAGWSSQRMAETMARLMARLGYRNYGAQGGDWGAGVVRWLAANDAACIGSHSNFPPFNRPEADPLRGVTQAEVDRGQKRNAELADHKAYGAIQGTRPLTLGYGLNDSPAGLAAWIVDKFWAWSDHGGKLENSFTRDELLTNVTVYWVSETMPSSTRIYFESQHNQPRPSSMSAFTTRTGGPAPMGFALFPKEINVPPRAWVERAIPNVVHWTEMPRGGHFAAMEQPELLVADVRKFFSTIRAAK
ncbi:MAG: alpha/beta fold hydrolase [Planctomycetia bacterium]|nr:alpha/beta fold hydrolase [Planctomycetia bacterium]